MLEKYLAPWGNKVPWINKVIELKDQLVKALASLARVTAEYARLQKDFRNLHNSYEEACDEIHRLKEKEYNRNVRPMMDMLGDRMECFLGTQRQVDIGEVECYFRVRTTRFALASINDGLKHLVEDLVTHRKHAASELAKEILKHIEFNLCKKGLL